MKLTLRKKLGISFALLIIMSITALGMSSYHKAQDIVLNEIRSNNEQALRNVNDYYLKNFMTEMAYVVDYWSEDSGIVNYQNMPGQPKMVREIPDHFEEIAHSWKGYLAGNPDIAWIYLGLESDGSLLLAPLDPTMPLDYDCRTRDWYKETISRKGKVHWTEPYLDAGDSGETIVTVSKSVWKGDTLIGVVGMDIKLQKFSQLIRGINANGDGYLMLMGPDGDIYAHPDDRLLTVNMAHVPWVNAVLTSDSGTDFFDEKGQKFIFSYLTVPETGWKLVGVRPVNLPAAIGETRSWTLDTAAMAGLFILLSVAFLTHVFLKPLNTMMAAITRVSEGNMDTRLQIVTNDEFGVLSKTFNLMLERIQGLVRERDGHVEELTRLLGEVKGGYLTTVRALANAIEANDNYTRGHCDRVRHYAMKLGEALGFSEKELNDLEFASMLHDVGKIGISQAIICKPERLTEAEFAEIKKHPAIGAEIISDIPFLEACQTILRQHHERVDGKGYPDGIVGREIHYAARILAIADAYDAMTSIRPYRAEPLTPEEALHELKQGSGTQFDPILIQLFINIVRKEMRDAQDSSTILIE